MTLLGCDTNLDEPTETKIVSSMTLIALIDDDEPFRVALVDSLLSLGYEARGFASAEEFMTADEQIAWGCVITDIHMPGMSGFDLKRKLGELRSEIPVIMITAWNDANLEAKVAASGAVCFLRKPIETPALLKCLKTALGA